MAKFLIIAILALSSLFVTTLAQEETECRGKPVTVSEAERAVVTNCLQKSKIENIFKIPLDKLPCFGVCLLSDVNLLTADGKINHEKSLKYIADHMPDPETQKMLIDAVDQCIKDHGEKVKVDNDPNCQTFMEVGVCVHDAFLNICIP